MKRLLMMGAIASLSCAPLYAQAEPAPAPAPANEAKAEAKVYKRIKWMKSVEKAKKSAADSAKPIFLVLDKGG